MKIFVNSQDQNFSSTINVTRKESGRNVLTLDRQNNKWQQLCSRELLKRVSSLIPAWIRNYIHYYVWNETMCPFPKVHGAGILEYKLIKRCFKVCNKLFDRKWQRNDNDVDTVRFGELTPKFKHVRYNYIIMIESVKCHFCIIFATLTLVMCQLW